MIHRLHHIPDAGNLSAAEMSQIVNANTFAPNSFQCGSQSVSDHLVGQMATAPNGWEQQRLIVFRDERIEMMFDIGANMRRDNHSASLPRFRGADMAAFTMNHAASNRNYLAVISVDVMPLGPAGTYTVNYRVTSADGHVVSGSWPFQLTTAGTGRPGPPAAAPGNAGRIPAWPFLAIGAVLAVGAGWWALRRRRGRGLNPGNSAAFHVRSEFDVVDGEPCITEVLVMSVTRS